MTSGRWVTAEINGVSDEKIRELNGRHTYSRVVSHSEHGLLWVTPGDPCLSSDSRKIISPRLWENRAQGVISYRFMKKNKTKNIWISRSMWWENSVINALHLKYRSQSQDREKGKGSTTVFQVERIDYRIFSSHGSWDSNVYHRYQERMYQ